MRPRLLDPRRVAARSQQRSKKQESRTADDLGGQKVVASGSQWHSKGDVSSKRFLVECKTTEKKQYPLRVEDLNKIRAHGILKRKDGIMQVEYGDGSRWAVLDWNTFLELVEAAGGTVR